MAAIAAPILRTSERAAFKRCMWRWWKEYREGYRPRGVQADALWFGIGIHEALALWYQKGFKRGPKRGWHPADYFEDWTAGEIAFAKTWLDDQFDESVWVDATELGVAMLDGYVKQWGLDPQWEIIATEQEFRVRITRHGKTIAIFASRWDGVLRNLADNKIYLLENKTASQISTAYLEIDDQAGSYWAVASQVLRAKGILKPGEEIAGIIYNFLRKAMPDDRPQNEQGQYLNKPTKDHYVAALAGIDNWTEAQLRKMKLDELDSVAAANFIVVQGDVSKSQPPPLFYREPIYRSAPEQATQLERISDEVAVMNAVREGIIPITKTTAKDCPRCPFFNVCLLHERGADSYRSVLRSNFVRIDPYKDMRKAA